MPGYSTILCCTDFSAGSDRAFEEASYLAALSGGRLHLLHVIPSGTGEAALAVPAWQHEADEAALLTRLERTYGPRAAGELEIAVATGDARTEILAYAHETGAALIVIGARCVGRLEALFSGGSVAEHVTRAATIPVLVVNREAAFQGASPDDDSAQGGSSSFRRSSARSADLERT
jgi:nucleotide-binding universal stress UspA family protein